MMMRRCGRCRHYLPIQVFAWRRVERGQRDNYCRRCRAAYKQEHYQANKERYVANAAARHGREVVLRMKRLLEYLSEHPCVDCGLADPVVLEFDHTGIKRFDISRGLRDRPWKDVLDEIKRCDVVCANCHRIRTAKRGGFLRSTLVDRPG